MYLWLNQHRTDPRSWEANLPMSFRLSRNISAISYRKHRQNPKIKGIAQTTRHEVLQRKWNVRQWTTFYSFAAAPLLASATRKTQPQTRHQVCLFRQCSKRQICWHCGYYLSYPVEYFAQKCHFNAFTILSTADTGLNNNNNHHHHHHHHLSRVRPW